MQISLCMIVKNEENCLANCLDSIHGLVDEIIIVDTGSTDNTKEIAARYTDKLYDFPWIDDFAAARNFSFSKGTKDYLMWLDADDILTEDDHKAFCEMKRTLDDKYVAVYMPYLCYLDGAVFQKFSRERIVKKSENYIWQGEVHETLVSDTADPKRFYHSQVAVTHTKPPHKSERNLNILEKVINRGNPSLRMRYFYATELRDFERLDESIDQFELFFQEGGLDTNQCLYACIQLHKLYVAKVEYENALGIMSQAMPYCQDRSEFCCELGDFYRLIAEDIDEAIFWYEAGTKCPYGSEEFSNRMERYYYYIPYFWLWNLYSATKQTEKADTCLQKALYYMKKLEETGEVLPN